MIDPIFSALPSPSKIKCPFSKYCPGYLEKISKHSDGSIINPTMIKQSQFRCMECATVFLCVNPRNIKVDESDWKNWKARNSDMLPEKRWFEVWKRN